jgi:hypothetical protein
MAQETRVVLMIFLVSKYAGFYPGDPVGRAIAKGARRRSGELDTIGPAV